MKSICDPFIKRPIATILLSISISLLGIASYRHLPISALPKVDYPVIVVTAQFPGMSAEMMTNSIASPLEKEFMKIDGLKEVLSESRLGSTTLTLNFELDHSIDVATVDVQAAIARSKYKLPSDMPFDPQYMKKNPNSDPIFYIGLASESMPTSELYDYANIKIGQQLSKIDGVSQVQVFGIPRAVRINLDNRKLQLFHLSADDVIRAVQSHSMILSMGRLKGQTHTLTLTSNGQLMRAKDYRSIVVKVERGRPVYLEDIAKCEDASASEDTKVTLWVSKIKINTNSVVVLAVNQASGANTVEVSKRIRALLPHVEASLPPAIKMIPIYDKASSILDSINEVKETIVIAFILVAIVIFLFLGRVRETIIPIVAIPLSLFITFVVMKELGYSLDNLSLMALTLAIGFLVDDAIVFLENVVRHMEHGMSPMEASFKGASEISFTILSMTFSLMATFLPIVFMDGQIGRIFREFSITIIVSIFASGIVSLTLTPVMCSRFLRRHKHNDKSIIEQTANYLEQSFIKIYRKQLQWVFQRRSLFLWIWVVCIIGMIYLFVSLPKSFLPAGDSGSIMGVFMAQTGVSPTQMHRYQEELKAVISKHPASKVAIIASGTSEWLPDNQGIMVVVLKDLKHRKSIRGLKDVSIDTICKELQGMMMQVPGILPLLKPMPVLNIQTSSSSNNRGKYVYTLTGMDSEQVRKAAQAMLKNLAGIPGIDRTSINCNFDTNNPVMNIDYNRRRLFQYGLAPYTLEAIIKNSLSLNYAYLIKGDTEQYKVIVASQRDQRMSIENIANMQVKNQAGKMIPMDALANFKKTSDMISVFHKNNFPSADIFFNLSGKMALGDTLKAIESSAKNLSSSGVDGELGGESKEFMESMRSLTFLLCVAVFVMYVVLGCLYEHWIHPLTVLSTLPIALAGGLLTLLIFHQECSLYAFIGLFMLMGIIKKNGIILVDFAVMKQKEGEKPEKAILDACCERFRPILMTTVCTVLGILPIACGIGADGASRVPLGLSVAGGLIFAQVMTLYVTPVVYLFMDRFVKTEQIESPEALATE